MNLYFRPDRPTARSSAFAPFAATPGTASTKLSAKALSLSPRQLMDVELGLYLLSELLPEAQPDVLPALLTGTAPQLTSGPAWTARQRKRLSRGRALLNHLTDLSRWNTLLSRYSTCSAYWQAYDISPDLDRFVAKTVGFSRNRIAVLHSLLR